MVVSWIDRKRARTVATTNLCSGIILVKHSGTIIRDNIGDKYPPTSGFEGSIMLQPPMVLTHQQLYQQVSPPSSSIIDSSLHPHHQQHQHQVHISPPSSRLQVHCKPVNSLPSTTSMGRPMSPLPTTSMGMRRGSSSDRSIIGRGASSDIETGVWTGTDIPAGVTFGPYDGEFTLGHGMKDHRATPYMLEVSFLCLSILFLFLFVCLFAGWYFFNLIFLILQNYLSCSPYYNHYEARYFNIIRLYFNWNKHSISGLFFVCLFLLCFVFVLLLLLLLLF